VTTLTFLGTGNYEAPGRYWNSFVIDGSILVEPSPTCLPNLRKCGLEAAALDAIFISHFHPDHTFGWPFLVLELIRHHRDRRLTIVGPPGVADFLSEMMVLASVADLTNRLHEHVDIHYVEADGTWQQAGDIRFRAIEVEHVPALRCYGFLIERDGLTVGYSGDTHRCAGLDELAGTAGVLVVECNGTHPYHSHMDTGALAELRKEFPGRPFVLTHVGEGVDAAGLDNTVLPDDFQTLTF
jgi:ribonuclease BN (tRNA processing enzyme)